MGWEARYPNRLKTVVQPNKCIYRYIIIYIHVYINSHTYIYIYIASVPTSWITVCAVIRKTSWLMLFRKITGVCYEIWRNKEILCGKLRCFVMLDRQYAELPLGLKLLMPVWWDSLFRTFVNQNVCWNVTFHNIHKSDGHRMKQISNKFEFKSHLERGNGRESNVWGRRKIWKSKA
jgi:hypothetical protein